MEIDEIIEEFEWFDGTFKREAVEAAVARRDEVIPELLLVLEEIADPKLAADLDADGEYMALVALCGPANRIRTAQRECAATKGEGGPRSFGGYLVARRF